MSFWEKYRTATTTAILGGVIWTALAVCGIDEQVRNNEFISTPSPTPATVSEGFDGVLDKVVGSTVTRAYADGYRCEDDPKTPIDECDPCKEDDDRSACQTTQTAFCEKNPDHCLLYTSPSPRDS